MVSRMVGYRKNKLVRVCRSKLTIITLTHTLVNVELTLNMLIIIAILLFREGKVLTLTWKNILQFSVLAN